MLDGLILFELGHELETGALLVVDTNLRTVIVVPRVTMYRNRCLLLL